MITVKIRTQSQESSDAVVLFDEWPATELDDVIPTLIRWGGVVLNGVPYEDFSGQLIVQLREAFFEVVAEES